jgi:hypothetical protein
MPLESRHFRGDPKLEAAAISDPEHIMLGASGTHVHKIQSALILLDGAVISDDEVQRTFYGASTANAVLAYKQKRNIINRSYQTQADNIVGKMTMASLDREMQKWETLPRAPVRIKPASYWVMHPQLSAGLGPPHGSQRLRLNFAIGAGAIGGTSPTDALLQVSNLHVFPGELSVQPSSTGQFVVIDGWPGSVEIADPDIAKIRPAGALVPPGVRFSVVDNPQIFQVVSGQRLGSTSITATGFGPPASAASLFIAVRRAVSPMLAGHIASADDGALGFDTDTHVTSAAARQFRADGFRFCLRYLALGSGQGHGDLSNAEANDILDAGLALMPVQHVRNPGWQATGASGTSTGRNAADNARDVGFHPGVNVWMDLEGVSANSIRADVEAYCNNWFAQVEAAGYVPGIYVGFSAGLNGQQLGQLRFEHYWKAGGNIPQIQGRGYQMIQTIGNPPEHLHHIEIDRDRTQADQQGGRALWLIRP